MKRPKNMMDDGNAHALETSPLLFPKEAERYQSVSVDKGSDLQKDVAKTNTFREDIIDTFHLALPIFVSRVSYVGMKTTDTALLGHVSGRALSAAALSDLWTMCTGVLLQGRVLGILVGQSIGAKNYKLALVYLRISITTLAILSVAVMISYGYTDMVWEELGQPTTIAKDAGYYSFVFIFMIPAQIGFDQLAQFFSAQRVMKPEVITAILALTLNLVFGLVFVLGVPIRGFSGYGFVACPIVTVLVDWFQFVILFAYFRWFQVHNKAWKNAKVNSLVDVDIESNSNLLSSWLDDITMDRILTFARLYFPAALALSSDFWRMGVIGGIAASIGEREVGLFNASYRILWITLTFIGAVAGASGIKIAQRLGNGDHMSARQASQSGLLLSVVLLVLLSALVYFNARIFGMVFTHDEDYLNLFEECRLPFSCSLFLMNLAVAIETIPISMGRTETVFYSGFVASWLGQVPGVYFLTKYWRNDLYALYTGVGAGYFILAIMYGSIVYFSDWRRYAELAMERAEMKNKEPEIN